MNEVSKFDLFGEVIHIKDEYARSMLNRTSGNVTPVSYTHLDVYKRQE